MNTNDIIEKVLNGLKGHDESYKEIVDLIFTSDMKKKKYTDHEKEAIISNFRKLKEQVLKKKGRNLNLDEAFLWYRLTNKLMGIEEAPEKTIDVIEHDSFLERALPFRIDKEIL